VLVQEVLQVGDVGSRFGLGEEHRVSAAAGGGDHVLLEPFRLEAVHPVDNTSLVHL